MIDQHPDTDRLKAKLKRCLSLAAAWQGTAYRFVTVPYANRHDLLSGAGSRKYGARWNPPNQFKVVYGSLAPQTAVAEALHTLNGFGVPVASARPRVFAAVSFRLQSVLDLTSAQVTGVLALDLEKVLLEDWKTAQDAGREAMSQAIGRISWELKLEAMIVPSAVSSGERNIAVFPARRLRGSSWRIQGVRDLPKKDGPQEGTPDSSR
jgi:RES domain-containing protein